MAESNQRGCLSAPPPQYRSPHSIQNEQPGHPPVGAGMETVLDLPAVAPGQQAGLDAYGLCHPSPAQVLLALEPAQVGCGYGQRGVIQEARHLLDRLPGISA